MSEILNGTTLPGSPLHTFRLGITDEFGRIVLNLTVDALPSVGAEIIKWAADAFKEDQES